ncbi:hypothetical protein GCM10020367_56110 [Streptomyces sannanensis]|uniref:Uncharacterized protein n=1 Tax=Streptomyces sannanensis TaxID=285536 RepID=A0ABP6SIY2_9ACTN
MNIFSRFVIASGVARATIREHVLESAVDFGGDGKPDIIAVDVIRPEEAEQGLELPCGHGRRSVLRHAAPRNDSQLKK